MPPEAALPAPPEGPVDGFAAKPTLHGSLVVLRSFTAADIGAMGPVLADPEVLKLTGSVHSSEQANAAAPVLDAATRKWYETRAEADDRMDLAVIDRATGGCVGEVVLNQWEPENRSCNFRILIGPEGRNRGLGTEATRMLLDHAFANLDLDRVALEVYAFNPRARRVYENCGFRFEGTRRAALLFDGRGVDAQLMSVLRSDRLPAAPASKAARLVVIRGNSGSGKSTIARRLQKELDAAWIEQDHFRRIILGESGTYTPLSLGLIEAAIRTCLDAGRAVIADGIFHASKYSAMFARLKADYGAGASFFAFDLELPETLERHRSRGAKAAEFGEAEMRGWYRGWDALAGIDEARLGSGLDEDQVVEVILRAIGARRSGEPPEIR